MKEKLYLAKVSDLHFDKKKPDLHFNFIFPNFGIFNPGHFLVGGWIFSVDLAIKKIELMSITNNQKVKEIDVNLSRPDVVKNLKETIRPKNNLIGFHSVLNLDEILQKEENQFVINAVSSGNKFPVVKFSINKIFVDRNTLYPDFIIAGGMKCGTTALYDYICKHPDVVNRVPKEIHYFTLNHEKGDNWYRGFFAKPESLLIGESSPSYFDFSRRQPEIPAIIKKSFPKVKIIILLRNPTDRAISHFYHDKLRLGIQKKDINMLGEEELRQPLNEHPYIEHGLYSEKIKSWQSKFSSDSLLFLNNQELLENTSETMIDVLSFLNLPKNNFPLDVFKPVYSNKYPKAPLSIISSLDDFFRDNNEKVKELTGIDLNLR